MKYFIQIILLITAFQLNSQVGCNSYGLVLSTDKTTFKDSINIEKITHIGLFSQIELENAKTISILYESEKGDTLKACFLDDISIIGDISKQYSNAKVFKNSEGFNYINSQDFLVIENKTLVHHYTYDPKNKLLLTECGLIYFEIKIIAESCKAVIIKEHIEYLNSKQAVLNRKKEICELEEVIYHDEIANLISGSVEIEFDDSQNKVNQILADSFYLGIVLNENQYENYKATSDSQNTLSTKGKIIQVLLNREIGHPRFRVSAVEELETPNTYLVTLNYTKENLENYLSRYRSQNQSNKYEFHYLTKEKTEANTR